MDRDTPDQASPASLTRAKALQEAGAFADAADAYRAILGPDPALPKVLEMIGVDALSRGAVVAAAALLEEAATAAPTAERWFHLSRAVRDLDRLADAEAAARQAIALAPHESLLHNHLALVLREQGKIDDAIAEARQAVALAPDDAEPHVHLALCLLTAGRYEEGFREYEWRARLKEGLLPGAHLAAPVWDGGPLAGRTILLVGEQGLGDTLQFCRYAPLVAAQGGRVVLAVQTALADLCRSLAGVETVVASGETLPPFAVHAPLLSLPRLLGTTPATVPATVPYLAADPGRAARWREALGGLGFRVGIAWQGNPKGAADKGRSIPLRHFLPLARVPGVSLVSLQKGHGTEQLSEMPADVAIIDAGRRCDTFTDTAAVVANLDLVIASDSAVAHLAGALGTPVWIALKAAPAWRWGLAGESTPWYPTARLFRQLRPGDWASVFSKIADTLRQEVAARVTGRGSRP
jgi:tetratricopeptide (TPR) repeat protein